MFQRKVTFPSYLNHKQSLHYAIRAPEHKRGGKVPQLDGLAMLEVCQNLLAVNVKQLLERAQDIDGHSDSLLAFLQLHLKQLLGDQVCKRLWSKNSSKS